MALHTKRKVFFIISGTKEVKRIKSFVTIVVQDIVHTHFYVDAIPTCYVVLTGSRNRYITWKGFKANWVLHKQMLRTKLQWRLRKRTLTNLPSCNKGEVSFSYQVS